MATSKVVVDYVIFFPRFGKKKKKKELARLKTRKARSRQKLEQYKEKKRGRLKTPKGNLHKRRVKKKKVREPARLM